MPKISVKMAKTTRAGEKWHKPVTVHCVNRFLYFFKHQNVESAPVDPLASTWC